MSKEKRSLAQVMGVTRTVVRDREESDIRLREDRIGKYFRKYLNRFVFAEFSDEFLKEHKAITFMKGIPIPLRKKEVKEFAGGKGVDMLIIAENIAWVIGGDPHFKYTDEYSKFLYAIYNKKIVEAILKKGRDAAEQGEMDQACIMFRACLCLQYDYLHAMYSYTRALRVMYNNSRNEEYVGRFKAEALDWLELLTETHPRFGMGYYYLGYAYLNMGLYVKANAAWNGFMKFSKSSKDRKEIKKRQQQIAEPVEIELGCNDILAGKYGEGLGKLLPYTNSRFNDWWPLYYYIGVGYEMTGETEEAIAAFKKVLTLNGSHLETMKELVDIAKIQGDTDTIKKYSKKIELIEKNKAEEQKIHMAETKAEDERLQKEESKPTEPEYIELDESQRDYMEEDKEAKKGGLVKRLGRKK